MVPIEFDGQSVRSRLIMALPRLRRFAGFLAGDEDSRDILLRSSLAAMLDKSHEYQSSVPFDRWAFAEIHAHWMAELRAHQDPMAQIRAEENIYIPKGEAEEGGLDAVETVSAFLANLPPKQRSVVLLIFGEKFSYEDAAVVLDAPIETVTLRAVRGLASLVDRIENDQSQTLTGADVAQLYPAGTQPSQ